MINNSSSEVLHIYIYVTGFWKIDQDVTHEINRIMMFKRL